jgi:hypothetical protein
MSLSSLVHTVADALLEAPGDSAGREMQHGSLEGAATVTWCASVVIPLIRYPNLSQAKHSRLHSLEPSLPLILLQFKEAISSRVPSAGGSLGHPRLRWPSGCCEMRRTKLLSPAEGVGVKSLMLRSR